ncbi:MAG: carbohydrate porin [Hyphomicrobiales bacterium]|nr:carbohydrate porin [Acidobacteriaceae bacterium]MBV9755058.1 carbohydrate porin [Hyphomicrobiales bacterium]
MSAFSRIRGSYLAWSLWTFVLVSQAGAADLTSAPSPVLAPPLWDGVYLGGHIGYSFTRSNFSVLPTGSGVGTDSGSTTLIDRQNGILGGYSAGLQGGVNYVLPSRLLVGMESDVTFLDHARSFRFIVPEGNAPDVISDKLSFVSTARGRIGEVFGNWMVYGSAGLAVDRDTVSVLTNGAVTDTALKTHVGWTLGAGAEVGLTGNWRAKLEYLFMDFGRAGTDLFAASQRFSSAQAIHSLRLGLNYQFGWPGEPENGPKGKEAKGAKDSEAADDKAGNADGNWSLHAQTTEIYQGKLPMHAPFSGPQSLSKSYEARETATATGFIGYKLWDGTELYFNPEIFQGFGLNHTHGLGGFSNGEAQKAGTLYPRGYIARAFVRQTFGLGGGEETLDEGANQIGEKVDISRLTLTLGKLAVNDIFDNNSYAHDPRSGFMNWSAWEGGAFDYAADQIGYAVGGAAELNQKEWTLRTGYFLVSKVPNGDDYDTALFKRGQYLAEGEERYSLFGQAGKFRLTGWLSEAFSGSFKETVDLPALDLDVAQTRKTRTEYGLVANIEQSVTDNLGLFSRASWRNGRTEIMSFTDIDKSFSTGGVVKGAPWGRPDDSIGLAGIVNGLSRDYREFLAAGGLGVNIGDGQLRYRPEMIAETYYAIGISKGIVLTLDYQFVQNPAYNADRGPASIISARLHSEF